jgi:MoaA/NifB/PqqE/SkfB family radical SAM enzyme
MGDFQTKSLAKKGDSMKELLFGIKFLFENKILGKKTPLIAGLDITYDCNLSCRHCNVTERETDDMTFEDVTSILDSLYKDGGRTVYFEGGEPFLWRDGDYDLESLVSHANKMGFLTTVVYTNGTFPLETSADTVFISVDGLKETHDWVRGKSFDRIMKNIRESNHPSLFINSIINCNNKDDLEIFCKYVDEIPNIRGTFFYLHTPYFGKDELYIEPGERVEILHKLLDFKKRFKILNSSAGLKSAIRNDWERPLEICRTYEKGGYVHECCKFDDDQKLCNDCGILSYAEIDQTLKLKLTAIWNAMKYF